MNISKFAEHERKQLNKFGKNQLPHHFKKIGLAILLLSFLGLMSRVFMDETNEVVREISKKGMLIGMLIISISRDKIEDEMTTNLRSKSYAIAFICGVLYTIVMPYIDYGVSSIAHTETQTLKDLGDFQILLFMLMVQLMFFYTLKRAS